MSLCQQRCCQSALRGQRKQGGMKKGCHTSVEAVWLGIGAVPRGKNRVTPKQFSVLGSCLSHTRPRDESFFFFGFKGCSCASSLDEVPPVELPHRLLQGQDPLKTKGKG